MMDHFEQLLSYLSPIFGIPLHPDKLGACSIVLSPHRTIQLQLNISQENLLFFSKVIEVPPGKFRENVLKEALKANGLPDPLPAILGYLPTAGYLIAYQSYPLSILNAERLAGLLGAFVEMTESWYAAIQRGQSAPQLFKSQPSPFGMRP
jgi:hypothetical protein